MCPKLCLKEVYCKIVYNSENIWQQPKHLSVVNSLTKSRHICVLGYFAAYKDDSVELYLLIVVFKKQLQKQFVTKTNYFYKNCYITYI